MKLLPALSTLLTAAVLSVGVVVPAASAAEPVTLLGPENTAKISGPYPTFRWTPPSDPYTSVSIDVSAKKQLTADGTLKQDKKNTKWKIYADAATGVHKETESYLPGTYYWHVITTDADGNKASSEIRSFTVPLHVEVSKPKAKVKRAAYNGARGIAVTATVRCNQAPPAYYLYFTVDVYKGKKKIGTSIQQRGDCVGMYKAKAEAWIEPAHLTGGLKKGTKLTLKVYAESTHKDKEKGYPKYASKKQTVKFTWKG